MCYGGKERERERVSNNTWYCSCSWDKSKTKAAAKLSIMGC